MSLREMNKRLVSMHTVVVDAMIAEAVSRARGGPRASFVSVLLRWLPTDPTYPGSVYIDWTLLHDDELTLLGEHHGDLG
jgi:hypothetical protein